jgi:hypothetical protein
VVTILLNSDCCEKQAPDGMGECDWTLDKKNG